MKVKRFIAANMQQGLKLVREELGPEAVILSSRKVDGQVEIMAAQNYDEVELRNRVPEPERNKSTSELIRRETERHRQLEGELAKSRQRIAAVRRSTGAPVRPYLVTDEPREGQNFGAILRESKVGRAGAASNHEDPVENLTDTTGAGASNDAIAQMRAEISMLKDLLTQQLQSSQVDNVRRELEQRLTCLGVFPELQKKLLGKVERSGDLQAAWRYVLARLTRSVKTVEEELIEQGGIFALVGPTGSGKTTTIGKLAARYVLKHGAKGIALVTTDRYRIASHEQLLAVGRILEVPVRVVDDNHSLDAILDTLRDKKLVLIDTAGLNHHDQAWVRQMDELKSSRHPIQNHLVVSAINQSQVMKSTYHSYKAVGLTGCIITKLDEALTLGEAISLAVLNGLPVSYVTDGQRIPDDIHQARANQLVIRALTALHSQEGTRPDLTRERQVREQEMVV